MPLSLVGSRRTLTLRAAIEQFLLERCKVIRAAAVGDYRRKVEVILDYTVCSIHSRFGMGREEQTERIMRAVDNRYFTILGHATGRLLLKRPGYEIDLPRLITHARQNRRFFEVNCSPDRLDLSAENARLVRDAGIRIAISIDAHGTTELQTICFGLEQARIVGLENPPF